MKISTQLFEGTRNETAGNTRGGKGRDECEEIIGKRNLKN